MAKRAPATTDRKPQLTLRLQSESEREEFHDTARSEGFTTTAAWAMWHLRRAVKESRKSEGE